MGRSIYRGIPYKIEDEKFYKGFPCKKNNIGLICLNNFFMGMKFDFKFEIWENFYKGFPWKKKLWECSVIQIKFKRKSVVFFSRWSDQLIRTHLVLHVLCFLVKKTKKCCILFKVVR